MEAKQEFMATLISLAKKEGDKFRAEQGREPTEAEAGQILDMILRQARCALAMIR